MSPSTYDGFTTVCFGVGECESLFEGGKMDGAKCNLQGRTRTMDCLKANCNLQGRTRTTGLLTKKKKQEQWILAALKRG